MYKTLCVTLLLLAAFAMISGSKSESSGPAALTSPVIVGQLALNRTAPILTTTFFNGGPGVFIASRLSQKLGSNEGLSLKRQPSNLLHPNKSTMKPRLFRDVVPVMNDSATEVTEDEPESRCEDGLECWIHESKIN
jgi:hypothetical protein